MGGINSEIVVVIVDRDELNDHRDERDHADSACGPQPIFSSSEKLQHRHGSRAKST